MRSYTRAGLKSGENRYIMSYYTGMFGWLKSRKKIQLREELLTAALVRYNLEDASCFLFVDCTAPAILGPLQTPTLQEILKLSWTCDMYMKCIWKVLILKSLQLGACQGTRSRFQPLAEMPWCSRRTWAAAMRYDHFAVCGAW